MTLNIRKGDNVLVIAGKDKGKKGKVLVAMPKDNSVIVSGVNIIFKHKKAKSAQEKSAIVKKEGKIDVSNVQIICPACNKATRVAHGVDGEKSYRKCQKCGASLDVEAKKEVKKTAKASTEEKKTADKNNTKKVAEVKETVSTSNKADTKVEKKPATTKKTTKKVEK